MGKNVIMLKATHAMHRPPEVLRGAMTEQNDGWETRFISALRMMSNQASGNTHTDFRN